jgi:hypothetical protein
MYTYKHTYTHMRPGVGLATGPLTIAYIQAQQQVPSMCAFGDTMNTAARYIHIYITYIQTKILQTLCVCVYIYIYMQAQQRASLLASRQKLSLQLQGICVCMTMSVVSETVHTAAKVYVCVWP